MSYIYDRELHRGRSGAVLPHCIEVATKDTRCGGYYNHMITRSSAYAHAIFGPWRWPLLCYERVRHRKSLVSGSVLNVWHMIAGRPRCSDRNMSPATTFWWVLPPIGTIYSLFVTIANSYLAQFDKLEADRLAQTWKRASRSRMNSLFVSLVKLCCLLVHI